MHTYCSLLLDSNMMSAVVQGWTYSDGNLQWRLPAFKTSWHDFDKTQVCASHITRPSNDIIMLCCSVGTRVYFTIISHCGLSDPPGWLMPSYAFKRLQTRVTKRSTDCHTMKKKKKKDIWNYHAHCEFPHSAGDNFDAFILLAFLLSTVINPF